MTTIRQAILSAADHIEARPEDFDFGTGEVPRSCGTPGCALGWIGFYVGGYKDYAAVSEGVFGMDRIEFYQRLTNLERGDSDKNWSYGDWTHGAVACARALRLYADKYHPAAVGIPDVVRNIFTLTNEQLREALDA
jgi:hypothetical protein